MAKIVLAAIILMHLLLHRALPGFPGQLSWMFFPLLFTGVFKLWVSQK